MEPRGNGPRSKIRLWVASVLVFLVVAGVWKFIDYRMQPPPPPNPVAPVKTP
ncbi:MAG: hypothetical protein QOE73_522 [Verrucomicrobiota bacterium]|jgi:hypothetical protein